MSKTGIDTQTTFEGIQPAKCWGHYDSKFDACRTQCKVNQFCKPATARKASGKKPSAIVPTQPEKVESIPEPSPTDYFLDLFRGKWNVKLNEKKSSEKLRMYNVRSDDGALVVILGITLDGSGMVQAKHGRGLHRELVNSLDSAKELFGEIVTKMTT